MKRFPNLKRKSLAGSIAATFFALDAGMAFAALDEIIVTARKREESLQDVPVVVQAFTAEALESSGTAEFSDLNDQVSGMSITAGGLQPTVNLRGIQSDPINAAADESISINMDGVQHSSAQLFRFGLFDMESVEVLKGPQALFFGKNSPGGIVSIRSKNPTEEFFSEVRVGHEEAAERTYGHIIVSGPFNDTWGGRLAYRYQDADGYFENVWGDGDPGVTQPFDDTGPDFTENVIMAALRGEFDRGDVTLKVYNGRREGADHSWIQLFDCPTGATVVNPYTNCKVDDQTSKGPYFAPSSSSRVADDRDSTDYQMTQISLDVSYQINDTWEFNNILGWVDIDNFFFGNLGIRSNGIDGNLGGFGVGVDIQVEQLTEEFRFSGDFDNFRFMFGAFYDDRTNDNLSNVWLVAGANPLLPDSQQEITGESWSVFAQTDIDLTEQLELSIGARYTEEEREIDARITGGPVAPVIDPKLDFNNLSPEITLSWRPVENVTLFGSYKEGFKSGGYNASAAGTVGAAATQTPTPFDFNQETVDGYELGFKLELLDNTLRINGALFTFQYADLQLPSVVTTGGVPETRTINAGKATVEGIEVDFLWATPWPVLTVSGNVAYNDNEYDEYISVCSDDQQFGTVSGCDVDVDNNPATQVPGTNVAVGADGADRSGDALRRAPEWSGSLGLNFDTGLTDALRLRANIRGTYSDEYQTTGFEIEKGIQDSYWTFGGSVGVYAEDESWSIDLIGRNLSDEEYLVSGAYSTGTAAPIRALSGPRNAPREVMLQFTFRPDLFL